MIRLRRLKHTNRRLEIGLHFSCSSTGIACVYCTSCYHIIKERRRSYRTRL